MALYCRSDRCILFVTPLIFSSLKLCERSTNPQWNECFYFLVHNPKDQMLVVKARLFFTLILHFTFYSSRVEVSY